MSGVEFPLYAYPDLSNAGGVWNGIIDAKKAHPRVPFVVTINPASGPGTSADPNIEAGIQALVAAGVEHPIGYVPTNYAMQGAGYTTADIEQMIAAYHSYYPDLNGVMLDEMSPEASDVPFYQTIATYTRGVGLPFVKANPGSACAEGYVAILDNITVYENAGLPSPATLASSTDVPINSRTKFAFIAHDTPTLDTSVVLAARDDVAYMFVTNASEPNPYDVLPAYFLAFVATLDQ